MNSAEILLQISTERSFFNVIPAQAAIPCVRCLVSAKWDSRLRGNDGGTGNAGARTKL
jgi:hypothetical protein